MSASLLKPFRAFSPWAMLLIPLTVVALLVFDPASSFAGRRTRRAAATAVSSANQPSAPSMARAKNGHNPSDETVDLFEGVEAGKIAVRFIPKDSTQGRIFIKNKSGKPLNVRLPGPFAAVPVLAQMGMGGMGMGAGNGGGGQGMGGMGGGGMFNVPADKEANFKVPCVCLEHGKPEPRPQMSYSMAKIESFTTKPGVPELLTELGDNRVSQRAVQAAAWHLNNGMTWDQLAGKQIERADGSRYSYFSPAEVQTGMALAERAVAAAENRKTEPKQPSPGETASAK